MRVAVWSVGALVMVAAAVYLVGWLTPREHRASGSRLVAAPPERVYLLLADVERYPEWRPDVKRVAVRGAGLYREEGEFGPISYEVEVDDPPRRRVTRIADPDLPFGGTWTFEIAAEGAGSRLTITEDGVVKSPLFRFASRFVFGHTKTIEAYLDAAQRRLVSGS